MAFSWQLWEEGPKSLRSFLLQITQIWTRWCLLLAIVLGWGGCLIGAARHKPLQLKPRHRKMVLIWDLSFKSLRCRMAMFLQLKRACKVRKSMTTIELFVWVYTVALTRAIWALMAWICAARVATSVNSLKLFLTVCTHDSSCPQIIGYRFPKRFGVLGRSWQCQLDYKKEFHKWQISSGVTLHLWNRKTRMSQMSWLPRAIHQTNPW